MAIGVTGASGHLGRKIVDLLPDAVPIYRDLPERRLDALIHTAAPNYRDTVEVLRFRRFLEDLDIWTRFYQPDSLVIVGSWWQHATGTCSDITYTRLKNTQTQVFRKAVHVYPYSIYGDRPRPGRGFIPHLVEAIRGTKPLVGLSNELRDFIHVTDVALACVAALDAPLGHYAAATWEPITPRALAAEYNIDAPDLDEWPSATPTYDLPPVPYWSHVIDLREHITVHI